MKRLVLMLLVCGACATSHPPGSAEDPDQEMKLALQDLAARSSELQKATSLQDCGQTCQLSELVCQAAGQVCAIAGRHPDRADFAPHCDKARTSCVDARETCQRCKHPAAGP